MGKAAVTRKERKKKKTIKDRAHADMLICGMTLKCVYRGRDRGVARSLSVRNGLLPDEIAEHS